MAKPKKHKTPPIGASFETIFNRKKYRLTVVSTPRGVCYEVEGRIFKSPSGAAKSITKNNVNGWKFWKLDEG
jgi:hypothetical protein